MKYMLVFVLAILLTGFGVRSLAQDAVLLSASTDTRLSQIVTVRADISPVADILADLKAQTGIDLSADASIAQDRLIVFVRKVSLINLLNRLSGLHKWEWSKERNGSKASYRLFKPDAVAKAEEREQKIWLQGKEALDKARQALFAVMMNDATAVMGMTTAERDQLMRTDPYVAASSFSEGFGDLAQSLASLNPEERQTLAESSNSDPGVIQASSNSYKHSNMSFSRPLSSLPQAQQQSLMSMAKGKGASGDMSNASVSFYAANGSISLSVTNGDNEWTTGAGIAAAQNPEAYAAMAASIAVNMDGGNAAILDGNDPEVKRHSADKYFQEDSPLDSDLRISSSVGKTKLKFNGITKRQKLGQFLAAIHDQTSIPIVADGLLRSSQIKAGDTLNGPYDYTLRDALADLCVRFRRKIILQDGWLNLSSRRYAIYRLYEPPHDLVKVWMGRRKKQSMLAFEDYAEMIGALSLEQTETLGVSIIGEQNLTKEAELLRRHGSLFRLWNSLPPDSHDSASTMSIPLEKLTTKQRKDFWRARCAASVVPANSSDSKPSLQFSFDVEGTLLTTMAPSAIGVVREVKIPAILRKYFIETP